MSNLGWHANTFARYWRVIREPSAIYPRLSVIYDLPAKTVYKSNSGKN